MKKTSSVRVYTNCISFSLSVLLNSNKKGSERVEFAFKIGVLIVNPDVVTDRLSEKMEKNYFRRLFFVSTAMARGGGGVRNLASQLLTPFQKGYRNELCGISRGPLFPHT